MTASPVAAIITQPAESVRSLARYLRDRLSAWDSGPDPAGTVRSWAAQVTLDVRELPSRDVSADWQAGTLVLPVWLEGTKVVVGAAYLAGAGGPCPMCFETRWLGLAPDQELSALLSGGAMNRSGDVGLTGFAMDMVWTLVQDEARRALNTTGTQPPSATRVGWVSVLDRSTLRVRRHELIAESCCQRCARPVPDERDRAALTLEPVAKPDPAATRGRSAMEYDLPLARYANPVCGMLGDGRVLIEGDSVLAPVTGKCRPWNGTGFTSPLFWSGRAADVRRSERYGLLEGLERYAGGGARASYATVHDTLANLGSAALDPSDCLAYADGFYENFPVFSRFTPDVPLRWVWGWSFGREEQILVPEQLVYYMTHRHDEARIVNDCSNGCATGGSTPEAILYGLLELVERDAFMFTWLAQRGLPEIDVATCRDPQARFMKDKIDQYGYELRLFDARVDLPIPAVVAVAVRRDGGLGTLGLAAGAGLDPEDAIRAALCELATYVSSFPGRVEDELDQIRTLVDDYSKVHTMDEHALLYGLPEMKDKAGFLLGEQPVFSMDELYADWERSRPRTLNLVDDLLHCVKQVREVGLDVIAVDQTCPEQELVGVRTARVIVPGILTMDFGHGKQRSPQTRRLRTALRAAGKLDRDLEPSDINPHPHPFP